MNLCSIEAGFFKLDGGAMFGVVPKSLWKKTAPSDENNMCTWATRCLLIEDNNQAILIDSGIGDKQSDRFFSHYYLHGDKKLTQSIHEAGHSTDDITDVFLTHLHFDHCGGAVKRKGDQFTLTFPKANYWSNCGQWEWAINPNAKEKASFLKENLLPIQDSGHLHFVDLESPSPFSSFDIMYASGHTEKMMLPKIYYKDKIICFMADLIPSISHIPIPYVMAYDTRPLLTLKEKQHFLNEAADKNYILFFAHDPHYECCTVKHTEKGVRLDKTFSLNEIV